jgi:adenylosuccinate synthase
LETLSGGVPFLVDTLSLNREMSFGKTVVVEVPQGFSLSLNASGFYPYTTSRDCTLQQGLSDAGIHPRYFHRSMAVIRTYPIRVGNITDGNGVIGYSGDVYLDQQETSWSALGQPEERTTVTKRVRRVFDFSAVQYWEMLEYSEPDYVFLNFLNYMNADQVRVLEERMDNVERSLRIKPVRFYGYGPASHDISTYRRKIR